MTLGVPELLPQAAHPMGLESPGAHAPGLGGGVGLRSGQPAPGTQHLPGIPGCTRQSTGRWEGKLRTFVSLYFY